MLIYSVFSTPAGTDGCGMIVSTVACSRCGEGGQGDLVWGEWDSVSCYACGLASIDPETDQEVGRMQ